MTKTQQNNIFDESNNVAILSRSIPKVGIQLKTQVLALGKESNNQNGNLRWHLPLGVRPPPPLDGTNFQTFFTPLFFFCN